jgi:hypothetical protein
MRLFRQTRPGDWRGVIERVAKTLSNQMIHRGGAEDTEIEKFEFRIVSRRTRRLCGENCLGKQVSDFD